MKKDEVMDVVQDLMDKVLLNKVVVRCAEPRRKDRGYTIGMDEFAIEFYLSSRKDGASRKWASNVAKQFNRPIEYDIVTARNGSIYTLATIR